MYRTARDLPAPQGQPPANTQYVLLFLHLLTYLFHFLTYLFHLLLQLFHLLSYLFHLHFISSISYLISSISFLISSISYLISFISYLISFISYFITSISYLISSISYFISSISYFIFSCYCFSSFGLTFFSRDFLNVVTAYSFTQVRTFSCCNSCSFYSSNSFYYISSYIYSSFSFSYLYCYQPQGLAGQHIGEAKLFNFGVDAKRAVGCVLGSRGDSKEAQEVGPLLLLLLLLLLRPQDDDAISNLVDAGIQRLRLSRRLKYVS